jgi:DNA-binding MarR family transcriptional regulator
MSDRSDFPLDAETKALESPAQHHAELRLWLRLLTCSNLIETQIRTRLRERFDVTLPRFDLMAQLDRAPEGMALSQVSRRMMVSNGNVTHVVEKLVASGDIERRTSDNDRRVQVISLTAKGRIEFRTMAAEHESWVASLFAGLSVQDIRDLMRLLALAKTSVLDGVDTGGAA